jgi:hypothetical protein
MPIGEWRLAVGGSLFGPRLILAVISFWFKATAVVLLPPRNLHKSPYFMPRPQAFGFFQLLFFLPWVRRLRLFVFAVSSQIRPWSYCGRIVLAYLVFHYSWLRVSGFSIA